MEYAHAQVHALGAILPYGTPVNFSTARATRSEAGVAMYDCYGDGGLCMYENGQSVGTFSIKSLRSIADLDPFLLDGCLRIEAALHVVHRPGQQ